MCDACEILESFTVPCDMYLRPFGIEGNSFVLLPPKCENTGSTYLIIECKGHTHTQFLCVKHMQMLATEPYFKTSCGIMVEYMNIRELGRV